MSLCLVRHAMPAHGPEVAAAETDHPGWEERAAVTARFGSAVRHWLARAGSRPLVIATHGMALTLWLSATLTIADPGQFWAGLRFPDVLEVDPATGYVRRAPGLQ